LRGVRRLSPEELKEREPHVKAVAALLVPETGIVDYRQVAESFADDVRSGGGLIKTGTRLLGTKILDREIVLETDVGSVQCKHIINCAGLQCDRVARMCGIQPEICIVPFRGEYYRLTRESCSLVNHLIYPVPNVTLPFLGVHFTRQIHGGVEAGPNAVLAFKREGYRKTSFSFIDAWDVLSYRGFWKLAGSYWKIGVKEIYRSWSKKAFVRELRKLIPEITGEDLEPGGAGVRAQALDRNGRLLDDFQIIESPRMIHVLNAPSPAATASLSIGGKIATLAQDSFGLVRGG